MGEYLLELYLSRADERAFATGGESARAAAEELTRQGRPVQYRRSIYVPSEETCFVLFEAGSAEAVRDAARLAALPYDRVSAAITHI
jgi:hypothetical protein